jgi:hypothetical protein
MKTCPKCGFENEDTTKICVNCGYYFDPVEKNFEWVLLKTCKNQFEAEVLSNLLETNNIQTMMKRPGPMSETASHDRIFSMGANPLLGATGEFDVFVMRIDFNEAQSIVKAYEEGNDEEENEVNEDDNE